MAITIVAGQDAWDAAQASKEQHVRPSETRRGCWESESLVRWQQGVGRRWEGVELCQSVYGWSVRSSSGLDNFALLASSRYKQVDGTYEDAIRWAERWIAQEPGFRYAFKRGE